MENGPNLHSEMLSTTQCIHLLYKHIHFIWSFTANCCHKQAYTKPPSNPLPFKLYSSMGRQSSNPTMVSSSIALLQERFRQLQKVKERREEQQLLQMLSETAERVVEPSTRHYEHATLPFQSDMVLPIRSSSPAADSSLSLELDLHPRQADYYGIKTLPFTTSSTTSSSRKHDHSDLDTSLHL